MKTVCCFVLLIGIGILPVSGASVVWTNSAGGNWHTAGNWSPNQVPGGADDVFITNAGTYMVTVDLSGAARSITLGGGIGTQILNLPGPPLLVVSNAIDIGASGVLQGLGTLNALGDVVVNGEFRALGLVLGGSGALNVAGGGQLKLLSDLRVADRIVRNSGTVLIADGRQLFLGDNSTFTNFASGTVIFTNNNSGIQYNGNFPNTNQFFANEGTVRAHTNSFIDVPSAHRGTIEVIAGQFSLRRHPTYSSFAVDVTAACTINAGATLAFENATTEFRPPASANGGGNLRVSGGSFNLTGAYGLGGTLLCHNGAQVSLNTGAPFTVPHVINESGGDLRGSDPLTITGTLVWRNGARFTGPAPLLLAATAQTTLELSGTRMTRPFMANAGTMNWISADLQLETNCVFTNLSTGVIVITNVPFLQNTFVTTVGVREGQAFYNAGTIRATSDSPTEFSIPFSSTGTVRIERNEFRLTFNATFDQHAGTTELAGGTLRFFPGSNYRLFGGSLIGNGSVIGDDVESLGGIISPGTSPGQINFNQSLSLTPAGVMNIELGGTNAVTGFDQVTVADTATLSGGVLNVALANNFTPAAGMKFRFLTCAIRGGTFQRLTYPSNQVTLQLNHLPNGAELEVLQVTSSLQISPQNITLHSGDTQTFSASGGTAPYSFAVVQNNSGATISSSGLYTAGPQGGIDLVRVTDAANASVQVTVVVIPFDLIISNTTAQDFLNLLTSIEGSIVMSNIDARATLVIPGLASVGHDLIVRDNDQLVTLNLGALQAVGGTIDISGNPALTNISLPAMPSVAGNVSIDNNGSLTSIDLGGATSIGGNVSIDDNGSLTSIDLGNATSIGGDVSIDGNTSTTSIDLALLTTVGGGVSIDGNTSTTSIDLTSLTTVDGNVSIDGNTSTTNIDLPSLTVVGGDVDVTGNTVATNIEVGALTSAGSVDVSGNTAATNIDLGSLESVGDVTVLANSSASSVSLGSLTNVHGYITVSDNDSMTSLDLRSLATATGGVIVKDNDSMTSLDLGSLAASGRVIVEDNDSMSSLDLGSLTTATGNVTVSDNDSMTTVDLGSLATASGSVIVSDNDSMTSLDLSNLQSAGGTVSIDGNTSATGVELSSLTIVGGNVSIDGNTSATGVSLSSLATVDGTISIDGNTSATGVDLGSLTTVGGSVNVSHNATATSIDLGSLTFVSSDVNVSDNAVASSIDLGSLTTAGGSVNVSHNASASSIDLGSLTTVDGNVSVSDNTLASSIDLASLTSSGGSVDVSGNTAATGIDLRLLASTGGSVDVSGNTSATGVDLRSLATVGGSVDVSGNIAATGINLGLLTWTGGAVSVAGNTAATGIDLKLLASTGGTVDVSGNTSATGIDLGSLTSTGGSIDVSGNTAATGIDLGSLTNVSGALVVTSNALTSTVSFGSLSRIGDGTNTVAIDLRGDTFVFAGGLNIPSNVFLSGFGTLVGSVTNAGKIAPGASPGRFNISGHLTLTGSSELRFELGANTPGTGFDFLSVTGNVTLGGALTISLINQFERVLTNGASFTVLTAGSPVTGAFAHVASGSSMITTDGYARFTVRYAGEMAVRLTDAVLVDTDSDGMANWWEDRFGFNKMNSADATLDLDGDGASNMNEFRAGTSPDDPASLFRIVSVERAGNDVRMTWTTVGGKSYRVQTSAAVGNPFADFGQPIPAPGIGESITNLVDAGAVTNAARRYYRVRVDP